MKDTLARYGGAVVAVAGAVVLALWLHPLLDAAVILLMTIAVVAWFWGPWPALVASLLSTLALDYFFTAPTHMLRLDPVHVPRLARVHRHRGRFHERQRRTPKRQRSMKQLLQGTRYESPGTDGRPDRRASRGRRSGVALPGSRELH